MTKFITPTILIVISFAIFFVFTNPIYDNIAQLRTVASSYNEALDNSKAIEKDTAKKTTPETAGVVQGGTPTTTQSLRKDYGVWDLEFSTTGTYNNFLNFIKDLESNLRIVDISSIQFSSDNTSAGSNSVEAYKYDF